MIKINNKPTQTEIYDTIKSNEPVYIFDKQIADIEVGSADMDEGDELLTDKVYIPMDRQPVTKIKKIFIGVNGRAELCFETRKKWEKIGTTVGLQQPSQYLGSAHIGQYALIGGGISLRYPNSVAHSEVTAYTAQLTRSVAPNLNSGGYNSAGGENSNYAVFLQQDTIANAYNANLSKITFAFPVSQQERWSIATLNDYMIIGGEHYTLYGSRVWAYDKNLTRQSLQNLSVDNEQMVAGANDNYAIFAGGYNSNSSDYVAAYNKELTQIIAPSLSDKRQFGYVGATKGTREYVLVPNPAGTENINVYDKYLTRSLISGLEPARGDMAIAAIDDQVIFAGGGAYTSVVETYDINLMRTVLPNLSGSRARLTSINIEDVLLVGGGSPGDWNDVNTVDVYKYA